METIRYDKVMIATIDKIRSRLIRENQIYLRNGKISKYQNNCLKLEGIAYAVTQMKKHKK